ncbi:MAG: hypothetical protein WCA06_06605, partial [Terrimicrobiaceae bacterium]
IVLAYNIGNGVYKFPIWLAIAAVFLAMYRFLRVEYTVIDCLKNRLYLIKDRYHDQVTKAIQALARGSAPCEIRGDRPSE